MARGRERSRTALCSVAFLPAKMRTVDLLLCDEYRRGSRRLNSVLADRFSLGVPGQITDRTHQRSLQRPVWLKRPDREEVDVIRVVAVPDSAAVRRTRKMNQPLPELSLQRKRTVESLESPCHSRAVLSQRQRHDVALGEERPFSAERSHFGCRLLDGRSRVVHRRDDRKYQHER